MSSSPDPPKGHRHGQPGGKITIDGIDHVPNEILMDIFECVLQMSRRDVPFEESMRNLWFRVDYPKDIPPEESMLAPLRLSQVSRLWRSLALSFPSLWTDITVLIYKFDSTQRDEWFLNAVDTWLSRSGVSPLRLRVECDASCLAMRGCPIDEADDVPGPKLEITAHILRKVLDHQNRWRDASFTFIGRDPRMLPQLGLVDVPLLESLSIYWEGRAQRHAMAHMNLDISRSPRLRSLHLVGIPRIMTGGLSNLRELTLISVSASLEIDIRQSILLEILQSVPNLQVLDIRAVHCKSDNPQSSFITLPGLHTLAIDDFGYSAFIISRLVLPGLKRLICNPFHPDGQEFSEMLVRSRPALEYFETPGFVVNGDNFSRFLRLMPGLKTLCMAGVLLVPDLLEMLSLLSDMYPTPQSITEYVAIGPECALRKGRTIAFAYISP
ncbi:uncharacterized protein FOMMEDRAFT_31165 [Fomitiporia mediterranea MF3/22]|uniref:uncharacterized protein n=1 Tax=Fomitiporia mediterranea (strain MF3/22) TaxID=694068 RepID=UPI0004407C8A|nr:uncharacterized protein FOMMEDRAFT_31165 [Fomitiporia mediterranea MF3/22]EJC99440.1 hypothetical protein FOMMEDRAFT_31165 [Fomitiporia mediterranea MF3/22]